MVRFDAVTLVRDPERLREADAVAAGVADLAALQRSLHPHPADRPPRGGRGGDKVYRIRLSWVGEDPRIALRSSLPGAEELADLQARLARLDAVKASGPWTRGVLEWIRDHPHVVSTELAALLDRELLPLKVDIRKLKALGLTISHDVGYELSPRGAAYLDALEHDAPHVS